MFGDDIESDDIGDEAANWISEFLGKDCRMSCRPRHRHLRQSEEASFHKNWRLGNISKQILNKLLKTSESMIFFLDEKLILK